MTRGRNKNSFRNMRQYKDLSDDEFDKIYNEMVFGVEKDEVIQDKFDRIMGDFENEYDLSELLPNDRIVLKSLVSAMIQLQDYEVFLNTASKEGVNSNNIVTVEKISNICKSLRNDISNMQNDLGITRKTRKNDKEQNVLSFIEDLKKKAAQFSQQKMQYIFCEKCGVLLTTVWWKNPETSKNKIVVHCNRKLEDDEVCGWSKSFSSKELAELNGSNRLDLMPESMR